MSLTEAERKARLRASYAKEGRKAIHVELTAPAAAKLAAWVAKGESIAAVVNRLLTRSKP
jgi:hypothetical protein